MAVITVEQNVGMGVHHTVFYTPTEEVEPPINQGRMPTLVNTYGWDEGGFWAQKAKNPATGTVTRIVIPYSLMWRIEEVVNDRDNPF